MGKVHDHGFLRRYLASSSLLQAPASACSQGIGVTRGESGSQSESRIGEPWLLDWALGESLFEFSRLVLAMGDLGGAVFRLHHDLVP